MLLCMTFPLRQFIERSNEFVESVATLLQKKDELRKHVKSVHAKIKDHECGECDYNASRKCHLQQHIKAVHKKERDFACGECEYASSKKV